VRIKVKELDELFDMMHGISQNYLLELDDDDEIRPATEWFDIHDKDVFTFKQSIVDYLHEAKEHLKEKFSRSSVKSKNSSSARTKCGRIFRMHRYGEKRQRINSTKNCGKNV
jgi:hypothetical protein